MVRFLLRIARAARWDDRLWPLCQSGQVDREHIVFERRPELHKPVVVMAVRGWNDAGEAASGATDWIKHQLSAHRFAHIDPEEFFDFQVARPTVELVDGTTRRIDWPAN